MSSPAPASTIPVPVPTPSLKRKAREDYKDPEALSTLAEAVPAMKLLLSTAASRVSQLSVPEQVALLPHKPRPGYYEPAYFSETGPCGIWDRQGWLGVLKPEYAKMLSHGVNQNIPLLDWAVRSGHFSCVYRLLKLYRECPERPTSADRTEWPVCGACPCPECVAFRAATRHVAKQALRLKTVPPPLPVDSKSPRHERCFGHGAKSQDCNLSCCGLDGKRIVLKPALETTGGFQDCIPLHALLCMNPYAAEKASTLEIVNALLTLARRDPRVLKTVWLGSHLFTPDKKQVLRTPLEIAVHNQAAPEVLALLRLADEAPL